MKLGAFSVSLNVKDINASKEFYEKLGFTVFGGDITQKWLILKNEKAIIGLFEGMLEKNTLTFNPKWDENATEISGDDISDIKEQLKNKGITFVSEDEKNIVVVDPDGNPILLDQHV